MNFRKISVLPCLCFIICCSMSISCGGKQTAENNNIDNIEESVNSKTQMFNSDSAYYFIEKQLSFGPRVPGTKAHQECAEYLVSTLNRFGATVYQQKTTVELYNNQKVPCLNIIGEINPDAQRRFVLAAHWDCRPYSEWDINPDNHRTPVDGANDGASGVGVLLELARVFSMEKPNVGVDIVFFDVEDWGMPEFDQNNYKEDTWCLGSQYWAKNPHRSNYKAEWGILLDMVGAPDAKFYKEQISMHFAPDIVELVWNKANALGYSSLFFNKVGNPITDDHYYVNKLSDIRMIDIIHTDPNSKTGFGHYWHTQNDNINAVSKQTLDAVGKTVLGVLKDVK